MQSSIAKKIYVGNLAWGTDAESLRMAFQNFGVIEDVIVMKEPGTDRSRGFGFVTFSSPEEAMNAISQMNDQELCQGLNHLKSLHSQAEKSLTARSPQPVSVLFRSTQDGRKLRVNVANAPSTGGNRGPDQNRDRYTVPGGGYMSGVGLGGGPGGLSGLGGAGGAYGGAGLGGMGGYGGQAGPYGYGAGQQFQGGPQGGAGGYGGAAGYGGYGQFAPGQQFGGGMQAGNFGGPSPYGQNPQFGAGGYGGVSPGNGTPNQQQGGPGSYGAHNTQGSGGPNGTY